VGQGTVDWPALMAALRDTSAKYFVVEHDNPSDAARFAERSLAAAKNF
jgi:sugar phosphate isomerase/epimerase